MQAVLYTAICGMIASNGFSQQWHRKITKLNCVFCMIVITINCVLVAAYTSSGTITIGLGLMILWTLAAIVLLIITIFQFLVNVTLLPKIITSIPVRLYNVLYAEPKNK
jgi:hypothetical protein